MELIKNYGVCTIDENHIIRCFEEKPKKPKSQHASTACYLFKLDDLILIKKYLKEGKNPDAMGFFIGWLIDKTKVHGYAFEEEWFDIGSFESLEEARCKYSK
jgi:glucose-1-phosphate thymidylyltransferase